MELADKVIDAIEKKGMTQAKVSAALGWHRSVLWRFLNGGSLYFHNAVHLSKHLFGENWLEVIDEYCLTLDTDMGILSAFEYASTHDRQPLIASLSKLHKNKKAEIQRWVSVYKVHGEGASEEALDILRDIYGKILSKEVRIKVLLTKAKIYYEDGELTTAEALVKAAIPKIKDLKVKNSFVKQSLMVAANAFYEDIKLLISYDTAGAIECADEVIASCASSGKMVAKAWRVKGLACMYDDFDESISCLEKAANIYGENELFDIRDEIIRVDIPFVKNVNRKVFYDDNDIVKEELAHQYIVRGEHEEALRVLDSLGEPNAISDFYRSMATRDFKGIISAYQQLLISGKAYYVHLGKREIVAIYDEKLMSC
ncbi:AimR family lysis-lysogeny pheromone receptor [Bacillus sp. FSL W7-1360]